MRLAVLVAAWYTVVANGAHGRGPHHPRGSQASRRHSHHHPVAHQDPMHDIRLLHDTEHFKDDLGQWARDKDLTNLSSQEKEFFYFELHDFDKNKKLDGLEILRALQHIHHGIEDNDYNESQEEYLTRLDDYIEMIDLTMAESDTNNDGFIDYGEYKAVIESHKRQKDEIPQDHEMKT